MTFKLFFQNILTGILRKNNKSKYIPYRITLSKKSYTHVQICVNLLLYFNSFFHRITFLSKIFRQKGLTV